jgi:hypothetical protein
MKTPAKKPIAKKPIVKSGKAKKSPPKTNVGEEISDFFGKVAQSNRNVANRFKKSLKNTGRAIAQKAYETLNPYGAALGKQAKADKEERQEREWFLKHKDDGKKIAAAYFKQQAAKKKKAKPVKTNKIKVKY